MVREQSIRERKTPGTFEDRFVKQLEALCDESGETSVTNAALREALGWPEERYKKIKAKLYDRDVIGRSQGHGGKVRLLNATKTVNNPTSLKAFISYSHSDETIKNELVKHLYPLTRLKLVDSWHDGQIKAGEEFGKEISKNLEAANIIVLLVSVDFINSKYCYEKEMTRAMQRHQEGSAVVIPVIVRQCLWQHTPFAELLALPKDGRAISTLDQDEALTSVSKEIFKIADQFRGKSEI